MKDLNLLRAEAATARTVELDRPPVHPADSRCPTTVRAVLPNPNPNLYAQPVGA